MLIDGKRLSYMQPIPPHLLPKPGMVFNSYRELAAHLEQPIKTGAAYKRQMQEWLHYFTWVKGPGTHKILITEFKGPPLTNGPGWSKQILPMLVCDIAAAARGYGFNGESKIFNRLIISSFESYVRYGLVNSRWNHLAGAGLEQFSEEDQYAFREKSVEKLRDIMYTAVSILERVNVCKARRKYLILNTKQDSFRLSSDEEVRWITSRKAELLLELDVVSEARLRHKRNKFYARLAEAFEQAHPNQQLHYAVWDLAYLKDKAEEEFRLNRIDFGEWEFNTQRIITNHLSTKWHIEKIPNEYEDLVSVVIPTKAYVDILLNLRPEPELEQATSEVYL